MNEKVHYQYPNEETKDLFQAILRLQTMEECEQLFRDLCTLNELKNLTERWEVAKLVHMGFPYRVISRKTGASSATIARVAHWMMYGTGGYVRACMERETFLAELYGLPRDSTYLGSSDGQKKAEIVGVFTCSTPH